MDEKELDQMREIIKELTKELKATAMARKPVDVESYLKTKIKNVQERTEQTRKGNKKLEMSEFLSQLLNGERGIADFSETEKDDLSSHIDERLACARRHLATQQQHADASVTGEAADDVATEVGGPKKKHKGESSKSGGADDDA